MTAADWTTNDPVLEKFEIGIEVNAATGAFSAMKMGDGATVWSSLPYMAQLGQNATAAEIDRVADVSAYQEEIVAAGALSVTAKYSGLAVVSGGAVTLAAPSAAALGQIKTIEMTTDDGDVTLALTNIVGQSSGTGATFNSVGDALVLVAAFDKWIVLKEHGIALA